MVADVTAGTGQAVDVEKWLPDSCPFACPGVREQGVAGPAKPSQHWSPKVSKRSLGGRRVGWSREEASQSLKPFGSNYKAVGMEHHRPISGVQLEPCPG